MNEKDLLLLNKTQLQEIAKDKEIKFVQRDTNQRLVELIMAHTQGKPLPPEKDESEETETQPEISTESKENETDTNKEVETESESNDEVEKPVVENIKPVAPVEKNQKEDEVEFVSVLSLVNMRTLDGQDMKINEKIDLPLSEYNRLKNKGKNFFKD